MILHGSNNHTGNKGYLHLCDNLCSLKNLISLSLHFRNNGINPTGVSNLQQLLVEFANLDELRLDLS